ncbi:site-2 protease family protein [Candidatus Roizmanbacteria bacterium]|nr:site-2 protease family protein [Candidatus Roizmanbacteria bacterium]
MISQLFSNPLGFAFYIFALLVALTIHEASHAWVADRLGDPTARLQGRISLNPLVHIDLYGAMFLLFFGFGWGKPVQFDPFNLKNPRKDGALISLAGPASNLSLALILSIVLRLFIFFNLSNFFIIGSILFVPLISMNVILGLFNLIPIHPLDGFAIVSGLLPREKSIEWEGLRRYGMIFLILLIIPLGNGSMLDTFLHPLVRFVTNLLIPVSRSAGIL